MDQVHRSVVRILFPEWIKPEKKKRLSKNEKKKEIIDWMVIPGVILSVDTGNALIAANSTFFKKRLRCVVNFPNAAGYEDGIDLDYKLVDCGEHFCTFTLRPREDGYIQAVKFETQPVNKNDEVKAFVFPRESFITPVGFPEGFIISASKRVFQHYCPMHEYGYLGSPIFNLRDDLVGITYLDTGHFQAWTVFELQEGILMDKNCTFVSDGKPVEAPAASAAQVEE
ncbi:unnamed protein product [Urochloa humidicola]